MRNSLKPLLALILVLITGNVSAQQKVTLAEYESIKETPPAGIEAKAKKSLKPNPAGFPEAKILQAPPITVSVQPEEKSNPDIKFIPAPGPAPVTYKVPPPDIPGK